jgi:hypothetical protein
MVPIDGFTVFYTLQVSPIAGWNHGKMSPEQICSQILQWFELLLFDPKKGS